MSRDRYDVSIRWLINTERLKGIIVIDDNFDDLDRDKLPLGASMKRVLIERII